jgi:hypothetical protein
VGLFRGVAGGDRRRDRVDCRERLR